MRDFKKLTSFPGHDKAVLKAAAEKTGLSVNQIIVRCVHDHLTTMIAELSPPVDLSPLPESAVAAAYRQFSKEELAEDRELSRASVRAQRA